MRVAQSPLGLCIQEKRETGLPPAAQPPFRPGCTSNAPPGHSLDASHLGFAVRVPSLELQIKMDTLRMSIFICSARRDSNPRPPPWQGGAPPLSHSRINDLSSQQKLYYHKSEYVSMLFSNKSRLF